MALPEWLSGGTLLYPSVELITRSQEILSLCEPRLWSYLQASNRPTIQLVGQRNLAPGRNRTSPSRRRDIATSLHIRFRNRSWLAIDAPLVSIPISGRVTCISWHRSPNPVLSGDNWIPSSRIPSRRSITHWVNTFSIVPGCRTQCAESDPASAPALESGSWLPVGRT